MALNSPYPDGSSYEWELVCEFKWLDGNGDEVYEVVPIEKSTTVGVRVWDSLMLAHTYFGCWIDPHATLSLFSFSSGLHTGGYLPLQVNGYQRYHTRTYMVEKDRIGLGGEEKL